MRKKKKHFKWVLIVGVAMLLLIVGGYYLKLGIDTSKATQNMLTVLSKNGYPKNKLLGISSSHSDQEFFQEPIIFSFSFSTKSTAQESKKSWQSKDKSGPTIGDQAPIHYQVRSQVDPTSNRTPFYTLNQVVNGNIVHTWELKP